MNELTTAVPCDHRCTLCVVPSARLPVAPTARFPVTRTPLIIRFAFAPSNCRLVIIVLLHITRITLSPSVRPVVVVVLVPATKPSVAIVTTLPDVSPLVTIVIPVP